MKGISDRITAPRQAHSYLACVRKEVVILQDCDHIAQKADGGRRPKAIREIPADFTSRATIIRIA